MPKGPRSERPPPNPRLSRILSKYRPEFAARAREYSFLSAKADDLAILFNVSKSTVENWARDHEDFKRALLEGQELANLRVVRALHQRAIGMELFVERTESSTGPNGPSTKHVLVKTGVPPDTAAALGWLKNRAGWKDAGGLDGPLHVIVEGGLPEPKEPTKPDA